MRAVQIVGNQDRFKSAGLLHKPYWHASPSYGNSLGTTQSSSSRLAADSLQQQFAPFTGTVVGYDLEGLLIEGPGFTGGHPLPIHSPISFKQCLEHAFTETVLCFLGILT